MGLQASVRCRLLVLGIALSATVAAAQPPPVGPPINKTNKKELAVSQLTLLVRGFAQAAADMANKTLEEENRPARASIEEVRAWPPYRSKTTTPNKPNSWNVRIPYLVRIKVSLPVTSDRHIGIPVDVECFCEGWHTKSGTVTVRAQPGPASIEGGNILEDVVHVRDYLDAQVRSSFSSPLPVTQPLLAKCITIGASDGGTAAGDDDLVLWDTPPRLRAHEGVALKPTIEVTFNRVKRLRARNLKGEILYKDVESILLKAFANYSQVQKGPLSMREGDVVTLGLPTVRLDADQFDSLIVIGSIEQPPNNPKDSAFAAADKAQNYAPGSHVLAIPKWYTLPPTAGNPKPQFIRVPAYELSYTVRFVDPRSIHP
jgi:hypothetical protein